MQNEAKIAFPHRLSNVLFIIICCFLLTALAYCTCSAFLMTANMEYTMDEATYFTADHPLRSLLLLLILMICLWLLCCVLKKISSKHLFLISAVLLAVLMLYLIQQINLTPTWDAYRTFKAAEEMLQGKYDMMYTGGYISDYPFQIPLILYNCILISIFGDQYIAPQFLNLVYLIGIHWFLYRMSGIMSDENERTKKLIIVLSFSFLPLSMYIMFVYSNLPGLFFGIAGLYFGMRWLKDQKLIHMISSYLLIGIACLFKGLFYIYLIAVTIIFILSMIRKFSKKALAAMIASVLVISFSGKIIDLAVASRDPNIQLKDPLYVEYALEMGSKRSLRGAGWHDGWLETYLNENFSTREDQKKEADRIIHENFSALVKDPHTLISFYADKLNSMWSNPEFEGFWTIQANKQDTAGMGDITKQSWLWIQYRPETDQYNRFVASYMTGSINRLIRGYLNTLQNLIFLLALISAASLFRNRDNFCGLLLPLTFLGGFLFLIFWEAKAQYSILFFITLFPSAACMLDCGFSRISRMIHSRSGNHKKALTTAEP